MSSNLPFTALFAPKTVAVIGNCENNQYIGRIVLENLLKTVFPGKVYVINPCGDIPADREGSTPIISLTSVTRLPQEDIPLDLAYLCCPAEETLSYLEELARIGTKAAVIASSGFKDVGGAGTQLEEEIARLATAHNMAVLGPNSQSIISPSKQVFLTDSKYLPHAGSIGFFAQSRSFFNEFTEWAYYNDFGISSALSLGNKAVISETDILEYLGEDPATAVITGYIEDINDGQRFLKVAHSVTRQKPVIILRSGRTAAGARAASVHSGYVPGADIAYEAAFRQTGIIRVNSMADLLAATTTFASRRLPKGPGVGILTNSGANAIIAADSVEQTSLCLASLNSGTIEQLSTIVPSFASYYNPVDLADTADENLFAEATQIMLNDSSVHSLFISIAKTEAIDVERYCNKLIEIAGKTPKPVILCLSFAKQYVPYVKKVRDAGIACLPFPETAIKSLERLYKYAQWRDGPYPVEVLYRRDFGRAQKIIQEAFNAKQTELNHCQAYNFLRAYEMPVLETKLARTSNDAVQTAKKIGYPVALKIVSPQISNKTDIHGIRLGLSNADEVRKAFLDITNKAMQVRKDAYIVGCLVQALAPANSRELTIGFKRTNTFGPIVYFGLSGVQTGNYKDFSCRVAPLSLHDAPAMVKEIKSFPLLAGLNNEPIKFTAIEDILLILSTIAVDFPEIREIACDPVMADKAGAYMAGLRIMLDSTAFKIKTRAQGLL